MPIQQMFLGTSSSASAEPDGSVYFDGINDRLTLAATSDFAFDTNDFTIEAFVNRVADNKLYSRILHFGPYWSSDDAVGFNFDDADHANKLTFGNYKNRSQGTVPSNGRVLISNSSVSSYEWYHVAVTRHNGVFRLFINGVLEDTNSSITSNHLESSSTNTLAIGGTVDLMGQEPFNANISNVRVLKGTALYTNSFVPPSAALTNVNNTTLLCCQSDTDAADKAVGGTVYVEGALPSSKNPFPFNPLYSVEFDGNDSNRNDYLSIPANSDLNLDGEFTIEAWVKVDDDGWSGTRRTLIANNIGWTTNHFAISLMNSGSTTEENCITLWDYNANSSGSVASSYPARVETNDGWTHIAVTRDSANNIRIFKNGVQAGSTYNSSNSYLFGTGETWIGQITMSNLAGAESLDGKISNLRIVKGQALYTTSSFTPALSFTTTSQGAIESNVKLLCCNTITKTGATVSPASITANGEVFATSGPTLPNYSVDFDGSDDYLTFANNSDLQPGSGDFTFEAWINPDSWDSTVYEGIYVTGGTNGIWLGNSSGNWIIRAFNVTNYMSVPNISTHIPIGQWTHVAVTREGTNLRLFFNGVLQSTVTNDKDFSTNASQAIASDGYGAQFNGKISNLRFVKGTAVYTSAFTPSTERLTIITNTKLLCCNKDTVTGSSITPTTISTNGNPLVKLGPF